ncbi:MAG: TorF family putative porin [Gammaproteobacteria bacterium]|nr:TorF family putative porin [Gammaproteobacteria bacterium]MBU1724319.1 TorF family putative porin [Gammaproteobacteria bacterium]MBU2006253.1 TorF family putative porin [Gammaproteobacteria bacterium]
MKKGILLTATILGSLFVSAQAVAGASANIGATSNYIWRGQEQAAGSGAFSAGLDYEADNGLYVGAWASSLRAGEEVDVYGGYAKELENGVSYDVGAIKYVYPSTSGDFAEVYGKLGYKGVEAEVDYTVDKDGASTDEGDVYYALGYSGDLPQNWSYGAKVGRYNYKAAGTTDLTNVQLSATKSFDKAGDFTFAIDDLSGAGNDPLYSVSWGKSFDF